MVESLTNRNDQGPKVQVPVKWSELKDEPFGGDAQLKNQFDMLASASESKETLPEERFDSRELPLSNNPKLRAAQEKFLRGEPLSVFEKIYDRDGAAITTNIGGYELKTDHAYRVVSDRLYKKYIQDGAITRDIDEYAAGQNNGGVDWYLGGAAAATRKYGDKQDDVVVLECPADKEYFSLTSDNGNGMVVDPRIRHIKSSSKEHPVPIDKITNIFHISHTGQIRTLDKAEVARAKVISAFKSEAVPIGPDESSSASAER